MRRTAVAVALVVPLLTGCGDATEDYCETVHERQQELSEVLGEGGPTALLQALPIFEDLAEQAPRDIRDEWDIVVGALEGLRDALADAGVDPATYDREDPPAGLTDAERTKIDAAARELASPQTQAAFAGVEQQARDVCKTPLHL